MNIIVVPDSRGKGKNFSLTQGQIWLLAAVLFVAVPMLIGTVSFRIQALLHEPAGDRPPQFVADEAQRLVSERRTLEVARRDAEAYLNALAQRLGHLQAQMLRLNALGQRLTQMAGLKGDFNFDERPALGGPEERTNQQTRVPDFLRALEELSHAIDSKSVQLQRLESVMIDRKLKSEVTPTGWPVDGGWMSSSFGLRADPFTGRQTYHEGVDIANRLGSPIRAMAAGVVVHAGQKDGYGLMVEVKHDHGMSTRYAHAKELLVQAGDKVERGDDLALVGSSGRSTGPHLHFEVLQNGRAINPARFLRAAN